MTAVASPPTFTQHNRPNWGMNGVNGNHDGQLVGTDNLNRMLMPRKSLQRNNSSSSIASTSSTASTSTAIATPTPQSNGIPVATNGEDMSNWTNGTAAAQRKRPQGKAPWPSPKSDPQAEYAKMAAGGRQQLMNGLNGPGSLHAAPSIVPSQGQITSQQPMARPMADLGNNNLPVLYLLSLNGTFERKTVSVPFAPDTLRIGRQTNNKTIPTPVNGYFDSKVLSRQHAELWADRQGKIWIRDVKSSNGTFVNGTRLSPENRESEPHELQTGDHLELGIDIVSEDQKTVVHHKVAAKVEHAGFLNASNNLLDVSFGDLDPTNGPMMMMGPQGAVPVRQRNGSQSSVGSNGGRMVQGGGMMGPQSHGMGHQRGFFFSPISTEQIVKRLQQELRNARLQSQDLGRTDQFVHAFLGKEEVKDMEKPEISEMAKPMMNGGAVSFRSDTKTRFSDPPAPPPQQPLPEKPDVPVLKRGITERAKPMAQNMSPIRHDGNGSQILQLTEALNNAKREIESQSSRMREMEEMLFRERRAREVAEELARRLEETAAAAAAVAPDAENGPKNSDDEQTVLSETFEPPNEGSNGSNSSDDDTVMVDADRTIITTTELGSTGISLPDMQAQLESMALEMNELRQQLDVYKNRAETAEAERDSQRKSLAELALQIRQENEARQAAEEARANRARRSESEGDPAVADDTISSTRRSRSSSPSRRTEGVSDDMDDRPTLLRSATITQSAMPRSAPESSPPTALGHNDIMVKSLPYASMIGVVIIGMGLMVYINGWPPQPRIER
ncbi:hypothetical protein GGS20DRAFT_539699 [Poronia punctata]|nr:hypothetical protein GGS20DRAFT_539699 [Poronia punctata]